MPTPLYPLLEKSVSDSWERLDRDQITPWFFMTAGPLFQVKDFFGKTISYQGLEFDGSPQDVFWGRYIEPFLEDITDRVVKEALHLSAEKAQDPRLVLPEVEALLKSVARRTYQRMMEVDCRLRGKSFPQDIHPRSATQELQSMEMFIVRRITAELTMCKSKPKLNAFFNNQPFWFWLINFFVSVVTTFLAG